VFPFGGVFDRGVHIIVVGCGRVGSGLAIELDRREHDVVVVDKIETAFRRLPPEWGGTKVVGAGFDRDRLDAAGADHADALAAVTSGDNSNILTARIARETYSIPAVVARIYDPRRAEIYRRLGIPTVATVTWTIDQAIRTLFPEHTTSEWSDPTGMVHLIERSLPDRWCGKRLDAIETRTGARIVAVTRGGRSVLANGDLVGQLGDVLHAAVDASAQDALERLLGTSADALTKSAGR
jgi:trk system potassium uptake protein TrkA